MMPYGRRWLNIVVSLAILATTVLFLDLLIAGGIVLRSGRCIPCLGEVKFSCTRVSHPLIALAILLLLKPLVARPKPFRRAAAWSVSHRRLLLLALLVTASAAAPRLWRLGTHSLNPDALLWIDRGQKTVYALRAGEYLRATSHLGHPGVVPAALIGASYIYLGKGTSILSYDLLDRVIAPRLPIALLGILTCLLLYLFGRLTLGDETAFWGAIFLALYPPHIALSRAAHIDSTLVLFFMSAILSYLAASLRGSVRWRIASAIFFGLALLTKTPALLVPFLLAAWKGLVRLRYGRAKGPFLQAGDLVCLGLGLAVYFCLFTRLWISPELIHWHEYAGSLPRAAWFAAAVEAAGRVPLGGAAAALCAVAILCLWARRRKGIRALPRRLLDAALILTACAAFVRLFHRPIANELYLLCKTYHIEEIGHLKYWMGTIVARPPRCFYPFLFAVQSPPITLLSALFGVGLAATAFLLRKPRGEALFMCLAVPLALCAVMGAGHKMGFRYVAPAFPFLCLLAGEGLAGILGPLVTRFPAARRALPAAAGALLAVSMVPQLVRLHPYYDIYFNTFAGGIPGASRMISIGVRLGSREASAFLKTCARDDDAVYAPEIHGELRWHWMHDAPAGVPRLLFNRVAPPHTDWVVLPLVSRQKGTEQEMLLALSRHSPVWTFTKCGVDFVDVFRLDDPPATEGRLYEAEGLLHRKAELVVDDDASGGVAVGVSSAGEHTYGPWERYEAGKWRAVFRLRNIRGLGGAARLAVGGSAEGEIFGAGEADPADFPSGGAYRTLSVDFTLPAARRITFCVEAVAGGEWRFDGVAVERR